VEPAHPVKAYDVKKEDVTKVAEITSPNFVVEGISLGTPTKEIDKLLGKPIKVETHGNTHRCAYRNYGLYLDVDKYTGKVTNIYLNTLYADNVKGDLSALLSKGNLELLKKSFGDNPAESQPDPNTTLWEYPKKGIMFLRMKQGEDITFTLKLVQPRKIL
jgi:hypothetical protein